MRILGQLSEAELNGWYDGAAVFASSARYEPFGLSVLEAAQAGAALALADIPTFRELWDGAALFVGTDDEWHPALKRLLHDPAMTRDLGARARRRSQRYGYEEMVLRTLTIYCELAGRRIAQAV